jgi:hypothetical protein
MWAPALLCGDDEYVMDEWFDTSEECWLFIRDVIAPANTAMPNLWPHQPQV